MMTKVLIVNNEYDKKNLGLAPKIGEALLAHDERVSFEILHYTDISKENIQMIDPHMIFLTGRLTYAGDVAKDAYDAELELIRKTDVPMFGICLGHQLISLAYGAELGRMVEVSENEEPIREEGYVEMTMRLGDPLFNGVANPFMVYEYHLEEVKAVPENFELLASSEMCGVQAMRHKDKLIYSTQFHPEAFSPIFPEGQRILQNFFDLVKPKTLVQLPGTQEFAPGDGTTENIYFE